MKKQRIIHGISSLVIAAAALIGWRYLPPYLFHNPGVQILVGILVLKEALHFAFHGK